MFMAVGALLPRLWNVGRMLAGQMEQMEQWDGPVVSGLPLALSYPWLFLFLSCLLRGEPQRDSGT